MDSEALLYKREADNRNVSQISVSRFATDLSIHILMPEGASGRPTLARQAITHLTLKPFAQ